MISLKETKEMFKVSECSHQTTDGRVTTGLHTHLKPFVKTLGLMVVQLCARASF